MRGLAESLSRAKLTGITLDSFTGEAVFDYISDAAVTDGEKEKIAAFWSEYGVDDTATVKRITDLILEEPGNYLKYYVGYLKFRQMREQLALDMLKSEKRQVSSNNN